ncbi:hypothetical protein CTAYLR_005414 [Chrysophaeum taylorii]|uniref:COP9 signalosome complex subunit 5 n=1 Tax=Chrysophaeum taylorii TaxID=2483200 RepID=A0AAD7XHK1_9STRA|nr:hypothetical protein CTAYLR_005414 [Chrysophaeum taylorii]
MSDPQYFKRVLISPVASVKMLAHAHQGCEEGMRSGGKPLEIMGMLLGCPHAEMKDALVVADVFPLPVTGFETRVVADDESVVNYMIELSELVEKSRKERLFGWYHSHPFDVDESHNHCFLSSTDMSTQLAWQSAEDGNGNPFLAIVIDPLRSFAKNKAELGAFRAYPPTYAPPPHQTPDGTVVHDEAKCVELWGSCWNRYYELRIEYFMSTQAKIIIDVLNHSFLWARTLGTVPPSLEPENRRRLSERVATKVTDKLLTSTDQTPGPRGPFFSPSNIVPPNAPPKPAATTTTTQDQGGVLHKAATAAAGLALEELHGQLIQATKRFLLNPN